MRPLFHDLAFCDGGIWGWGGCVDLGLYPELADAGDPIGPDRQFTQLGLAQIEGVAIEFLER
jgi:hypothetical protein